MERARPRLLGGNSDGFLTHRLRTEDGAGFSLAHTLQMDPLGSMYQIVEKPLGKEVRVVKLVLIVKRRADMSQAAFENHWRTTHAQLVQKHAETLRIKKYVQSIGFPSEVVALLRAERGWTSETGVDGVAELYWDSEEDMAAGMSTPEGQAAMKELGEDEPNLGDAIDVLMTKENVAINR